MNGVALTQEEINILLKSHGVAVEEELTTSITFSKQEDYNHKV